MAHTAVDVASAAAVRVVVRAAKFAVDAAVAAAAAGVDTYVVQDAGTTFR
jgi:hypothetical protein